MSIASPPGEVLLDVSRLIWRFWGRRMPTGIDRTCQAYLAHYGNAARLVVQRRTTTLILSPRRSQALSALMLDPVIPTRRQLTALLAGAVTGGRRSEAVAGLPYFNIGHTGLDEPGHGRWVREKGVRAAYFVHDLIPITHPEYCRPGEDRKHIARIRQVLECAQTIICNSESTASELTDFASAESMPLPPMVVAPLGIESPTRPAAASEVAAPEAPYFMMLGTIEARKNHLLILQLWAELARTMGAQCPHLVIVGQRGWECEQAVDLLDRAAILRGLVHELPRCSDEDVRHLLSGARALLFPSFVEGYGLPLVEALGAGTPVIASDLPVFRELAGDVPDFLHPIDGLGWLRLIAQFAAVDSAPRAAQIERLKRYRAPGWSRHFDIVDSILADFSALR
jgi:glycosyltransferase involved in cell wall biosynthesis